MSAHTPGPWDYFIGNANGRGLVRIETAIDAPVAGVHVASLTRGSESEANARLIAAAPKLLAAAERALAIHEGEACSCFGCQDLRAAIAKAVTR